MALVECNFRSDVLAMQCTMNVIIPQPTRKRPFAPGKRHPTLYLLHGLSDDHSSWQRWTSIERYADSLGLAVVMPAVHRSFYADMVDGLRYWTFISEELPRLARALFPLAKERERNFVAGLSMGGYGAFRLALSCPQKFCAAASLSGVLDVAARAKRSDGAFARELEHIFGPLDALAGSENDLLYLAGRLVKSGRPRPKLFAWCGTDDDLVVENRRFRRHARRIGLKLDYSESPGRHQWGSWDAHIQRVLKWLPI